MYFAKKKKPKATKYHSLKHLRQVTAPSNTFSRTEQAG